MSKPIEKIESDTFVSINYGDQEKWSEYELNHPVRGVVAGKHFLRQDLGLTGMEMSLNSLPEGSSLPYFHAHVQNEELYFFLSGRGEMKVDDTVIEVSAGTAVRVMPKGFRSIRSIDGGSLNYIVVQTKEKSLIQCNRDDAMLPTENIPW